MNINNSNAQINQVPADIRGLLYTQLDTHTLLAGRRVCRLWRNEIDRNNAVWIKVEGYTFEEFKEKCCIGENIKSKTYVTSTFTFNHKSWTYPPTSIMRRMIYQIIQQADQTVLLHKVDTNSKEYKVITLDAMARSINPKVNDFGVDHILVSSNKQFVILNTKTDATCITATDVLNGSVVTSEYGVVYHTKQKTLDLWNAFTQTKLFSIPFPKEVHSMTPFGKWLIVNGQTFSIIDLDEKRLHCEITTNRINYKIKNDRLFIQTPHNRITIYDLTTPSSCLDKGQGHMYDNLFCIESDRNMEFYDFDLNKCVIPKPADPIMDCIYSKTFKRIYTIGPKNKSFILTCFNSGTGAKVNEYQFTEHDAPFRFTGFTWSKYYLYMNFQNGYHWPIIYVFEPKKCKFLNEFLHVWPTEGDCLIAQPKKTNEIIEYSFEHSQTRSIAKKEMTHMKISGV